jgi:hypothetical protein
MGSKLSKGYCQNFNRKLWKGVAKKLGQRMAKLKVVLTQKKFDWKSSSLISRISLQAIKVVWKNGWIHNVLMASFGLWTHKD